MKTTGACQSDLPPEGARLKRPAPSCSKTGLLGAGQLAALPLDRLQVGEVLLTAAQSRYGLAVLGVFSFLTGGGAASVAVRQPTRLGVFRGRGCTTRMRPRWSCSGLPVYLALAVWHLWPA
jgi:hypothetical protein